MSAIHSVYSLGWKLVVKHFTENHCITRSKNLVIIENDPQEIFGLKYFLSFSIFYARNRWFIRYL